jgi:hypothetical protein
MILVSGANSPVNGFKCLETVHIYNASMLFQGSYSIVQTLKLLFINCLHSE